MPADVQQLWSGSGGSSPVPAEGVAATQTGTQRVSLWWYVMLLALMAAVAETTLASGYMGTQREEA